MQVRPNLILVTQLQKQRPKNKLPAMHTHKTQLEKTELLVSKTENATHTCTQTAVESLYNICIYIKTTTSHTFGVNTTIVLEHETERKTTLPEECRLTKLQTTTMQCLCKRSTSQKQTKTVTKDARTHK